MEVCRSVNRGVTVRKGAGTRVNYIINILVRSGRGKKFTAAGGGEKRAKTSPKYVAPEISNHLRRDVLNP
jgi:hypothetical protein